MARKSYKKQRTPKNKSRRQRGGSDGGATGYVGNLYGTFDQQMAGADAHNLIQPIHSQSSMSPASVQAGGGRKTRRKRGKKQRGGHAGVNMHSEPALLETAYPGQTTELSGGQKGGYLAALIERAAVPFGLIGLQRLMGKRARSAKKNKFKKR